MVIRVDLKLEFWQFGLQAVSQQMGVQGEAVFCEEALFESEREARSVVSIIQPSICLTHEGIPDS